MRTTTEVNQKTKALAQRCKSGDPEARRELYEHFYGKLLGISLRYCSSMDEARDVLHSSFLKIFQRIESLRNDAALEGWMKQIVVNEAIDNINRTNKSATVERDSQIQYASDDDLQPNEVLDIISKEDILEMVQHLPPAYRVTFNLYVLEGWTHNQISNKLGTSEGTSKSNLAKARKKLQDMINLKLRENL